jgi:formate dehydrogenase subunit delta
MPFYVERGEEGFLKIKSSVKPLRENSGRPMRTESMVHNANQIALHFASFPREDAIAGVLGHIQNFWERRMKDQLIDYIARGGTGLHELVLEAVKRMEVSA